MNAKKVNWIFLAMVLLNITLVVLLLVMYPVFQLGIVANLIVSHPGYYSGAGINRGFGRTGEFD